MIWIYLETLLFYPVLTIIITLRPIKSTTTLLKRELTMTNFIFISLTSSQFLIGNLCVVDNIDDLSFQSTKLIVEPSVLVLIIIDKI